MQQQQAALEGKIQHQQTALEGKMDRLLELVTPPPPAAAAAAAAAALAAASLALSYNVIRILNCLQTIGIALTCTKAKITNENRAGRRAHE